MDDQLNAIVLGALLHDIGKIVQRAQLNPKEKRHQEWGAEWLGSFPEGLLSKYADFSLYHHRLKKDDPKRDVLSIDRGNQGYRKDIWVVYEADNLSAGEREEIRGKDFNAQLPLTPVFWKLRLSEKTRQEYKFQNAPWGYPAIPLSEDIILPVSEIHLSPDDYNNILNGLKEEMYNLKEYLNSPDIMLNILYKFTNFIPSLTYFEQDNPESYPDISLYQHLKTTASIANTLYLFLSENQREINEEQICNREEPRYLLIGGDLSGIQDFIYTVTYKAALKGLRGRSFYLQLLTEHIVAKILQKLGLYRTSIVYKGGGSFYILAHNTVSVKKSVEEIRKGINAWLLKEHNGKLFWAIDWVDLNGNSFITDADHQEYPSISDAWAELAKKLGEQKARKFSENINQDFFSAGEQKGPLCDICGTPNAKGRGKDETTGLPIFLCEPCFRLQKLGEHLPEAEFVGVSEQSSESSIQIEKLHYHLTNYPKNDYKYLYTLSPLKKDNAVFIPFNVGRYPMKSATFENLVKNSIGAHYLGTLRMDVDNLGWHFIKGIPESQRTFSRLSTLSEHLSLFFNYYINLICEGKVSESYQFSINKENKEGRNVVIVYSGGDDLFITGAWSDITEIAFEIRRLFHTYTCKNPDVDISGGIVLTKENYPLYKIAALASEAEDESKRADEFGRKGRLSLFYSETEKDVPYNTLRWEEWENMVANVMENFLEMGTIRNGAIDFEFSSSLLQKFLNLSTNLNRSGNPLILPLVAYTIARGVDKKDIKEGWSKIASTFAGKDIQMNIENLKKSKKLFEWLILLSRR